MPKEEWGTKRLCPHCATRFYDLNNDPMTCPACANTFTLDSLISGRQQSVTNKTPRPAAAAESEPEDAVVLDDDDDADLGDDLLEDDDDGDEVSLEEIADVADDSNSDD